eukprot:g5849.t1
MAEEQSDPEINPSLSEGEDSDDEVSLLVVDEDELQTALETAGISIKVDAVGGAVEVSVESEDVSTFLMFAPEEEYLGAKVTGFVPRDDGGLSALEMHGQLVEGDVLTHLNGRNARLLDFSDILKACRGPERGGLPRPLVMKFSRPETLSALASPAPSPPSSPAAGQGKDGVTNAADGGSGGGGGAASLLADLDDFMGGLSLPGFTSGGAAGGADPATPAGSEEPRRIGGMSHIKGVLRAELQAQGMLGGGGGGGGGGGSGDGGEGETGGDGGNNNVSPQGEGIFLNMLRRLESVDVMGEDSPRAAAAAAAENGGGDADGDAGDAAGAERSGRAGSSTSRGADLQDGTSAGGAAMGGVGSSFAGVGAKLRSKFRKPGGGFGLAQGGGGHSAAAGGGGAADGVGEGGKAFVEGASKALAVNRERVMGWMKDLRPKDWSPKEAGRGAEAESLQELRRAVRRIYLDAPDPAVHTAMVVARARPPATKPGDAPVDEGSCAAGGGAGQETGAGTAVRAVDRVIGTGADRQLTKLVWFRSSTGGGFAEIKGVDGPYYQPSADDVGMHICIKCTLAGAALNFGGSGGLSPVGKGRRGRHARGGGSRNPPLSPQRHQAQVTFAEVGPIVLDPTVGAEVDQLVAAEGAALFEGLVRRDIPGEAVRVRVEVGAKQVRVLAESGTTTTTTTAAIAADEPPPSSSPAAEGSSKGEAGVGEAETEGNDGGVPVNDGEKKRSGVAAGEPGGDGSANPGATEASVPELTEGGGQGGEAEAAAEAIVLAEGPYSSGVLVALDPARPTVLKLTVGGQGAEAGGGGGGGSSSVLVLGAKDGRQRDVLALALRRQRLAALGPEAGAAVDDYPEDTKAQQAEENYLELKAAAAHFAKAYDEDGMSATEPSCSSSAEDDDEDDDGDDDGRHDDGEEEQDSGSYYDTSEDDGSETEGDSTTDGEAGTELRDQIYSSNGGGAVGAEGTGAGAGLEARGMGGKVAAAPWEAANGGAERGGGGEGEGNEPRSLSVLLEDLRQARAIADSRGRQLKAAHSMWEAGEASRQRAEAELSLVSSELDLLRPFSQSLAARAEGKETAEAKAAELDAEVKTLREQLAAAVESAEKLGSRAGTAEDEAGASASKLSGLEKVVRRLGGEAEVAHSELAKERAASEEAAARASKAERELDQARARAAVLDNKLAALEKEKLELLADANASKARAGALEEKFSTARIAEAEASKARISELEEKVSSLESDKTDAVSRMEEASSKAAAAEAKAQAAVKAEEETRTEMASKTDEVMRLTAQRNNAKSRADSLAKDLSRVCGGGRTLDQIEVIVTKYADLKVKMAMMEAEKDGEADLKDEWQSDVEGGTGDGKGKVSEAAKRALRENTELHGRVAAMAETLEMRKNQLDGQRQSNEFLLKRVEELEQQVANTSGDMAIGTD